ncbi:hypothetical protein SAMN06893096_106204 [Geodermatophilus pulveris]|uniref:Uncharacterized protein n=1 Tax=Geodermatophilus pulveris TaxID=1564159 RepID=A0A239GH78_9ACTN|nr:hypothetical protein [Geodermatophilus pulveris]SNS68557.1 hypothetical protein SAMN06893096_106204 [Geodermatophilus pulveris]
MTAGIFSIRRLGAAAALGALLVVTGCEDDTAAQAPQSSAAAESATQDQEPTTETSAPPAPTFVSAVCDEIGGLFTEMQAFSDRMAQSTGGGAADSAQVQQMVTEAAAASTEFADRAAAAQVTLAAAEEPTFDGGEAVAARADTAMQQVEQALRGISASLSDLDPSAPDYRTKALGQLVGMAIAVLPVITIFVDQDTLTNSAGLDAAQVVARSPGSVGFYREARDTPSCAVFFEGYDRAEIDALIGTDDSGTAAEDPAGVDSGGGGTAGGPPAEFLGDWYAHGAQLTIHGAGGVMTYGSTCGDEWCNDVEQFSYTVDDSTLTATITAVTVTDTQGVDRSAEQPPFHDVGYQFMLELQAPHVLLETPLSDSVNGPGSWCQDGAAPEDAYSCGQ